MTRQEEREQEAAMIVECKSIQTFRDPSEIVAIDSSKLTEVQFKTWLAMLYIAKGDFTKDLYEVSVDEIIDLCGYDRNDMKYFIDSIKKLVCTGVGTRPEIQYNLLGKVKYITYGSVTTLLAGADFDKKPGFMIFEFSIRLKEILQHSTMFANLSLLLVRNMDTKAALALYRVVNDYKDINYTPQIALEDLRLVLGAKKHEYKRFNDFNHRLLSPAIKQINNKTDLKVTPHFKRLHRKVAIVKFEIEKQPCPLLVTPPKKKDVPSNNRPKPYEDFTDTQLLQALDKMREQDQLRINLTEYDIKNRNALLARCKERGLE